MSLKNYENAAVVRLLEVKNALEKARARGNSSSIDSIPEALEFAAQLKLIASLRYAYNNTHLIEKHQIAELHIERCLRGHLRRLSYRRRETSNK